MSQSERHEQQGEEAARQEREIADPLVEKEERSFEPKSGGENEAMQAGAREYPVPPMPKQHLEKPGQEADLELKPLWDAPVPPG